MYEWKARVKAAPSLLGATEHLPHLGSRLNSYPRLIPQTLVLQHLIVSLLGRFSTELLAWRVSSYFRAVLNIAVHT